ncbi:hypothetical protein [Prosthecobacter sp.]|uniref:hypothetical protein n=1 Tax=Prosthecobacter sp. TaxID=1965333 RepID=UPI0037836465
MKPVRGTRLSAGVLLTDALHHGLTPPTVRHADDSPLRIEEPLRFHLARYAHVTRCLHGKFHLVAALLTAIVLLVLGWKAQHGGAVSPGRWFCGAISGWFIMAMLRLALFTCLAAPRYICYKHGRLHISGLGILRAEQILHWSIEHQLTLRACPGHCAKFQISCRWHGSERHWTMLMDEGRQTERLQSLLERQMPCSASLSPPTLRPPIPIEAGILSP